MTNHTGINVENVQSSWYDTVATEDVREIFPSVYLVTDYCASNRLSYVKSAIINIM